jgi:hypothetical protein
MAKVVQRNIAVARRGKRRDLVALLQATFGDADNVRIYTPRFGPVRDTVVIDYQHDSWADLEAYNSEFYDSKAAKEFFTKWRELTESHRAEIWRLH